MPNLAGRHQPKFGPADRERGPIVAPKVLGTGRIPCPRCTDGYRQGDHFCRSCGFDLSGQAPPPPAGRTVGVWTAPGPHGMDWYRPLTLLSMGLRCLLMLVAVCALAMTATCLVIYRDLGGSLPLVGAARPGTDWSGVQAWCGSLAALQLLLLGLSGLLVIVWTRRGYRNLPALDVAGTRLAPRWATLGWLVPGANLVIPKRIIDDTWRASDPAVGPWSTAWRQTPVPTVNHLWWVCTLVALPVVVLAQVQLSLVGTLPPHITSQHSTQIGYLTLAVAEGLLIFTAVLLARVVGSVGERQRERVRVLGPAAPFGSSPATPEPEAPAQPSRPAVPPLVRGDGLGGGRPLLNPSRPGPARPAAPATRAGA